MGHEWTRMHTNKDTAVIRVCPVNREPGSGVGLRAASSYQIRVGFVPFCVSLLSFLFLVAKKSWSAPPPDKPSGQGLFGLPEGTGAAPMTGAPAAHCLCIHRDQSLEDCTV